MKIQLANYQYTGSYAKLRNAGNKSFPYSVKVEGFGTSKTKGSLFDFASVSITEHFEKDKYGTGIINGPRLHPKTSGCKKEGNYSKVPQEKIDAVELPAEFDKFKEDHRFYYHGENISDYDLIKTAVASGELELPENITKCSISTLSHEAFKVLVQDEAKPKYPGSNTLYSEDGKYTFTQDSNGRYRMNLIDDASVGASLDDIANWMMSGTPNRNIETRYLTYLMQVDPDLYNRASEIGKEVRTYGYMEDLYHDGVIGEKQNAYDMSLLGIMFGKNYEDMSSILYDCRKSGDYTQLLQLYDIDRAISLQSIRDKSLKETGGVV